MAAGVRLRSCDAEPMFDCLDHVIVAVADLPAAAERYAALLGRPPSWQGEHSGAATAYTLFRLDNTYLELLVPLGEGAVGDRLRERDRLRPPGADGDVIVGEPDPIIVLSEGETASSASAPISSSPPASPCRVIAMQHLSKARLFIKSV